MDLQQICVLGSTGSIGENTLDVIRRHPDRFQVFALSASTQVEKLLAQIQVHRPVYAVMASETHASELATKVEQLKLSTQVLAGPAALVEIASHPEVDAVMAAIVGAAGLPSCMAAAAAGKKLLLANKEALVVGGRFFMDAVKAGGATLLPIDSEHSAIFQCLPEDVSTWAQRIRKILLTASGGPFRTRDVRTLHTVTPDEACAHPNWVMGRKISVDSATMMNKALEVIEAHHLFGLAPEQIEVLIHPQSVIHSMVEFHDASVLAQLGTPDMRGPIAYGLSWPDRMESGASALDFKALSALVFEEADAIRFPGLPLAWDAMRATEGTTAVLNAANEVAVAAFLNRQICFDQIVALNRDALSSIQFAEPQRLDDVLEQDARTRSWSASWVQRHGC